MKYLKELKNLNIENLFFKNKNIKTVIVYSTKPVGKIIGEFEIETILEEHPSKIWNMTKEYAGVTREFFYNYFQGREKGFAIKIKSTNKYDSPICPYEIFDTFTAPTIF